VIKELVFLVLVLIGFNVTVLVMLIVAVLGIGKDFKDKVVDEFVKFMIGWGK